MRGGDQLLDKNIPIAKTCHDGSLPVIGTQTDVEKKKTEEPKDSVVTPVPSPHVTPVPSPHVTQVSSPHHSPVPPVSATLLQPSSSPVQIVDLGDGRSSSSESTKFDEATKRTIEVEKG